MNEQQLDLVDWRHRELVEIVDHMTREIVWTGTINELLHNAVAEAKRKEDAK